MRVVATAVTVFLISLAGASIVSGQTVGFTTEPFIPVGKYAKAIDIGWGATGYIGTRLGGRKSNWVLEANAGAQWHAGDRVDLDEFPEARPDTTGDGDAVAVAGWLFPLRVSLTRVLGRAYFSPRVGYYIPVGGLKSKIDMQPSFGITPRVGYFFFITRDLTADLGLEYTVIFDSRAPLMYVGFSFGFLMGGKRLPRKRTPY